MFLKTIATGAALAAGIVSIFQNAPVMLFIKRTALTFIGFYFLGVVLNVLWNTAMSYVPGFPGKKLKGEEEEAS
ncbi:MAG: hypothetical protein JW814_10395 [Candidatus Krumholzibacteriota bacterium]|nr:hypothetical protein [Candidatus Krumholzibacteriota bacterium]